VFCVCESFSPRSVVFFWGLLLLYDAFLCSADGREAAASAAVFECVWIVRSVCGLFVAGLSCVKSVGAVAVFHVFNCLSLCFRVLFDVCWMGGMCVWFLSLSTVCFLVVFLGCLVFVCGVVLLALAGGGCVAGWDWMYSRWSKVES